MTRDQALAIMQNIDLIKHFANGGIIYIKGLGKKYTTNTIVLSNFRSDRPINLAIAEDLPAIQVDPSWIYSRMERVL